MTAKERSMVRALRDLVSDDDGAMEVIEALDAETRALVEYMADATALHQ